MNNMRREGGKKELEIMALIIFEINLNISATDLLELVCNLDSLFPLLFYKIIK